MRGIRLTPTVFALASGLVYVVALNSCSGGSSAGSGSNGSTSTVAATGTPRIQPVVIIFQENRTPDNLFHPLPNADIANTGVNSSGQTIVLQPTSLVGSYDLGHKHSFCEHVRQRQDGRSGPGKLRARQRVSVPS